MDCLDIRVKVVLTGCQIKEKHPTTLFLPTWHIYFVLVDIFFLRRCRDAVIVEIRVVCPGSCFLPGNSDLFPPLLELCFRLPLNDKDLMDR